MNKVYYAIGDIHGCSDLLKAMLKLIEEHFEREPEGTQGTIVFLGDYIDRGPDSKGVIDLIRVPSNNPNFHKIALKGNHEDMMLHNDIMWYANGGRETVRSFNDLIPTEIYDWIKTLPLYYETDNIIFVHAGLDPTIKNMENQIEEDLLWIRWRFLKCDTNIWNKTIVHGHTPVNMLKTDGWRINVDTGAVYNGELSCVVLNESGKVIDTIQINAKTKYFI